VFNGIELLGTDKGVVGKVVGYRDDQLSIYVVGQAAVGRYLY
jgi:hypothetical protein